LVSFVYKVNVLRNDCHVNLLLMRF